MKKANIDDLKKIKSDFSKDKKQLISKYPVAGFYLSKMDLFTKPTSFALGNCYRFSDVLSKIDENLHNDFVSLCEKYDKKIPKNLITKRIIKNKNIVIHCKTKRQSDLFLDIMSELGYDWATWSYDKNPKDYKNKWNDWQDETCYSLTKIFSRGFEAGITYSRVGRYANSISMSVIPYSDLILALEPKGSKKWYL